MTNRSIAYGEEMVFLIREEFKQVPEHRAPQATIGLDDALMSAYAIFSLKFPSLLQFEEERKARQATASNLESVFQVKDIPSDTQMRDIVDEVEPKYIGGIFLKIFQWLQNKKLLKPYSWITHKKEDHFLITLDGTGFFSSKEISCKSCLTRKGSKNEEITYHHQMLTAAIIHPHLSTVIPLPPEAIIRQDGVSKNDCEMNALKRWVINFRRDHPKLNAIINLDGLYGNNKIISLLRDSQLSFIIVVSETDQAGLFGYVNGAQERGNVLQYEWQETFGNKIVKTKTCRFRFKSDCPLNGQENTEWVNFFEYWEEINWIDTKRERQEQRYHCAWVTDISSRCNQRQAAQLVDGARARWKVENEAHNTLKNQGYNLEHSYGHGSIHLAENFVLLMLLAFLVDQIQLMGCRFFSKLMSVLKRKTRIWEELRSIYRIFKLRNWTDLLVIAFQVITGEALTLDSS
jgi:hypothetical protein